MADQLENIDSEKSQDKAQLALNALNKIKTIKSNISKLETVSLLANPLVLGAIALILGLLFLFFLSQIVHNITLEKSINLYTSCNNWSNTNFATNDPSDCFDALKTAYPGYVSSEDKCSISNPCETK